MKKQAPGRDEPVYSELDPGIRETVALLRSWGFKTSDSGDGVSKQAAGIADDHTLDEPHVICTVAVTDIVTEADRLHDLLKVYDVDTQTIEVIYNPVDKIGVLILTGVDDAKLHPNRPRGEMVS